MGLFYSISKLFSIIVYSTSYKNKIVCKLKNDLVKREIFEVENGINLQYCTRYSSRNARMDNVQMYPVYSGRKVSPQSYFPCI